MVEDKVAFRGVRYRVVRVYGIIVQIESREVKVDAIDDSVAGVVSGGELQQLPHVNETHCYGVCFRRVCAEKWRVDWMKELHRL